LDSLRRTDRHPVERSFQGVLTVAAELGAKAWSDKVLMEIHIFYIFLE
jgi:hypothetical protein